MAGYRASWRAMPASQRWMILLLGAAVALANMAQPYPSVAPLHHVPTVLLALAAPVLLARWPLSTRTVAFLLAFWLLHTLGGRYTYSDTPYDGWAAALTGATISDAFGFTRNHYDRLVHFIFGVASVPLLAELARGGGLRSIRAMLCITIGFVLAASAAYEVFEWLLTLAIAGDAADAYNGQQGDMWDAQKDMALAFAGTLCMIPFELRRTRRGWPG